MKIKSNFKDLFLIKNRSFKDNRGYFKELIREKVINKKFPFLVMSFSKKNVIRGLHTQRINSQGKFMGKIISELNARNIKLNITAVYSFKQTEKILKLINKKTKVIISIFAGRAGDVGKDPIPEFKKSINLAKKFKNVEILWASVREPYNYLQAKQLGCNIITIPPSLIEKIENFGKTFNQLTIETVKGFLIDSKKSKFKI